MVQPVCFNPSGATHVIVVEAEKIVKGYFSIRDLLLAQDALAAILLAIERGRAVRD